MTYAMVNTLQLALMVVYLYVQVFPQPHPACQMHVVYVLVLAKAAWYLVLC